MKYQPVIGLEVHVELATKTKMFCRCSTDYFGKEPNTQVCPVCLGLPGAVPLPNKKALEFCTKIGLALNCTIRENSSFERKNYFYPDLAKGYQVSQYRWPISVNGWIEVIGENGKSKIRINRAHQEEDTGKLTHIGGETLIDFNRSGVPLVEIVTEPDFTDTSQIKDYAKKLQQMFRYLGVSNADMEKGDMRLEANVSVRPIGQNELPNYRVELKNINSFRFMQQAVEYEIRRQIEALEKGEKLSQETRGWDEEKQETYLQRSKEEANDYRYFPDPDLPGLEAVGYITLPELPWDKQKRFIKDFDIKEADAAFLTSSSRMASFFEKAIELGGGIEPKEIANYIVNQKMDMINNTPEQVIDNIKAKKTGVIEDRLELMQIVSEVIKENPKIVDDFKKGKMTAVQALIGAAVKKAKVDVSQLRLILLEKLK